MSNRKTLRRNLMLFSATLVLSILRVDCSWGIVGCQQPTPNPCAADGVCRPNSPEWGYSKTRWRPWPGDAPIKTQADDTPSGDDDLELKPFVLPHASEEDLRVPKKNKLDKADDNQKEESPEPLPGADLLPGADVLPDLGKEEPFNFEPQGNQRAVPSTDDAPPALPSSLQQAVEGRRSIPQVLSADYVDRLEAATINSRGAANHRSTGIQLVNPAAALSQGEDRSLRQAIYHETTTAQRLERPNL